MPELTKFGLDLNAADITKLKGLSADMQETQIRSMQLEKDKAKVKEAQDDREAMHNADIAAKKKQIADFENMIAKEKDAATKESYKKTVEMLKDDLKELQGADLKTLTGIGDALADKYQKLDIGSYWNEFKAVVQNPFAQMLIGLAGITLLAAQSLIQSGLLTGILATLQEKSVMDLAKGGLGNVGGMVSAVIPFLPLILAGLLAAATVGLIIKAVMSMGDTEKQQIEQNKKSAKGTEEHIQGRIDTLRKEGQNEKADKLEKILADSRVQQAEINTPTGALSRTGQLLNPLTAIGSYWNSATRTSPTDVAGMGPRGAGPMPPGTVSGAGGGGGVSTQKAELVRTSTGTNARVLIDIPLAQAHAENSSHAEKMSAKPPNQ